MSVVMASVTMNSLCPCIARYRDFLVEVHHMDGSGCVTSGSLLLLLVLLLWLSWQKSIS